MSRTWSAPTDVTAAVRRRWDDGSLLRAYGSGEACDPIRVALRGPKASDIGDDLAAARAWVTALERGGRDGAHYLLEWADIGGRRIGRNRIPTHAVVASFDQAWALLGVAGQVRRFDAILELAGAVRPVRKWALGHPHRALDHHDVMPQLLAAYSWLDAHRGSGRYLREISAPGVDTKFAETHRAVLAAMLDVSATARGFVDALGLHAKPDLVRMRPAAELGLPTGLSEIAVRADELALLGIEPRRALVIENEITYLSAPVPPDGVVIWGRGFAVDLVGRIPWLAGADVQYWGDIDTHGFAILDRLRAALPGVRSVLMDTGTLLEHRDRWVTEQRPTSAALTRLTVDEQQLYAGLVTGEWSAQVRLEQERIDWQWAARRLGD